MGQPAGSARYRARLISLGELTREVPPDSAKVHGALRDLVNVFESLSNNAEAFMAGLARTIELQRADVEAVMGFKSRLIDYLQRFIGDLVTRSSQIAGLLTGLKPIERLERNCAPLVCTDGMPAAAQQTLLAQLATAGAKLRYHGDFDWRGLKIGNFVMREFGATAWRFSETDYLAAHGDLPLASPVANPVEAVVEGLLEDRSTNNRGLHM